MDEIGKRLIIFGITILGVGLLLTATDKIPLIGKLPGDIVIKRYGFTLYIPLATSILISVVLTFLLKHFK